MLSALPLLALGLLGLSPAGASTPSSSSSSSPCHTVTFQGSFYSPSFNSTSFMYAVDLPAAPGPSCPAELSSLLLSPSGCDVPTTLGCTYLSSVPPGSFQTPEPLTGLAGWAMEGHLVPGSRRLFTLNVRGEVRGVEAGAYALSLSPYAALGTVPLPACTSSPAGTPQVVPVAPSLPLFGSVGASGADCLSVLLVRSQPDADLGLTRLTYTLSVASACSPLNVTQVTLQTGCQVIPSASSAGNVAAEAQSPGIAGFTFALAAPLAAGASTNVTLAVGGTASLAPLAWAASMATPGASPVLVYGSAALPSCGLAAPAPLTPPEEAQCYHVAYLDTSFSERLNLTLFSYSLRVSNRTGCAAASELVIETNCPVTASWPAGAAKGLEAGSDLVGWRFAGLSQRAGTEHLFFLGVPTMVGDLETRAWSVQPQDGAALELGRTLVPNCECYQIAVPEPTVPNAAECVIVLSNSSVNVSAETHRGVFGVVLGADPVLPLSLTLSASCVWLSSSTLTFDATNWDQTQYVTVFDNPANQASSCVITLTSPEDPDCSAAMPVYKNPVPRDTTNSFGDPHLITFDRTSYISHGTGDFYFVRQTSGEMVIQVRQDNCAGASCNYGLAVRHRSAVFYLILSKEGTPTTSLVGNAAAEGMTVTASGTKYTAYLSNGAIVTATVNYFAQRKVYFLAIAVSVGRDMRTRLAGFCGFYDGVAANDLVLASGSLAPNLLTFQESWRVPAGENLFALPTAPVGPILGAAAFDPTIPFDASCCPYSPPDDITGALLAVQTSDSPAAALSVQLTNSLINCAITNATLRAAAEASCGPFFNDSTAACCRALGVSGDDFYSSCLCDFKFVGTGDFTYDNVQSFYDVCDQAAQAAGKARCPTCPRACTGQGTCGAGGVCTCNAGFRGADCSENWNLGPAITSFSPKRAGLNCNATLSITGSGFYGPSLSCRIGSAVVPAVKVSDFQVSCQVPRIEGLLSATVTVQVLRSDGASSPATAANANQTTLTLFESCCASPCQNGGRCLGGLANNPSFSCSCKDTGYKGDRCQTFINSCASAPCMNGGTCTNHLDSYLCNCADTGYFGPQCSWRLACPIIQEQDNTFWPQAVTFTQSWGLCLNGYIGQPSRLCQANGTFGPVQSPCLSPDTRCTPETFGNAQWPATLIGQVAAGTCAAGFSGSPSRSCKQDGTWETLIVNLCTRNACPAETTSDGISWPSTPSLTSAFRTCPSNGGTVERPCSADGTWAPLVGVCPTAAPGATCPVKTFANANWPATAPGTYARGTCVSGYTGSPSRRCKEDGTWESLVVNHCVRG